MSALTNSISALLPVRNGEKYLPKLLPSIINMLADFDELIVVNDGSTDRSQEIVEGFIGRDTRVRLINSEGKGLVEALNIGILESKNNWIARFDVDDCYSTQRLTEQRKLIKDGVAVIFADYQFLTFHNRNLGTIYSAVLPNPMVLSLISSQRTAHPVAVINRKLIQLCGYYKAEDFPAEDLSLWLRMSEFGEIVSTPAKLLFYRLSKGSISAEKRKGQLLRKKHVIQNFGGWERLQDQSLLDLDSTIAIYKLLPNCARRLYLHIRDIKLASVLTGKRVPFMQIFLKIGLILSLKILISSAYMAGQAIIRRIYRIIGRKFSPV